MGSSSSLAPDYFQKAGLVKIGDETAFVPDFPTGLLNLYAKAKKQHLDVCYYTMFGKEVVLAIDPDVIADTLDSNTEHYLWGGMASASKAFFGPKVLFVLEGDEVVVLSDQD